MEQERVFVTEVNPDAPAETQEERKRYPLTAKLLRSTCRSMWLSIGAMFYSVYLLIFMVLFVFVGALDRTGSGSVSDTDRLGEFETAFLLLNMFIVVLMCLVMYRLVKAIKEFPVYLGPVIAFAAAVIAFAVGGGELNPVVIALIYIGYMIMTIGTIWVCKKAHPQEKLLKSGIIAIVLLHVYAVTFFVPLPSDFMAGDWDGICAGMALLFQAAFYTIAASRFSADLPKRKRRSAKVRKPVAEAE
ncbi:MAG: hypothetical protein J5845_08310 [Lachnospiraceae bacterium]|nr:hypothetical protein [Lachnospiraceae bacterium]